MLSLSNRKNKRSTKRQASIIQSLERVFNPPQSQQRIQRFSLKFTLDITSDVLGGMQGVITMQPNGSPDWASCSGLYDEFRVLGIRVDLVSLQQYSVTSKNSIIGFCFDNDSSAIPANFAAIEGYDSLKLVPAVFQHTNGQMFSFGWERPASGMNTAIDWIDVATPGNSLGGILYSNSGPLTASTAYYYYVVYWYVEFRGRR
jgi:hypothetical protein